MSSNPQKVRNPATIVSAAAKTPTELASPEMSKWVGRLVRDLDIAGEIETVDMNVTGTEIDRSSAGGIGAAAIQNRSAQHAVFLP